jgi:hypothetical protein
MGIAMVDCTWKQQHVTMTGMIVLSFSRITLIVMYQSQNIWGMDIAMEMYM